MKGGYRQNAGRKQGFSAIEAEKARELICRKLSENLEPILEKIISQAKNGDIRATRELFDRAWGRPQLEENVSPARIINMQFDSAFKDRFFTKVEK